MLISFYAVLAVTVMISRTLKKQKVLILLFFLFTANFFVWNEAFCRPPEDLHVTFFDTGKADASMLEFPDGSVMLIDGGSGGGTGGIDAGRNVIAPYLRQKGIRKIDCIIVSHAHEDHFGGLKYILDNFDVKTVIEGSAEKGDIPEKSLYGDLRKTIRDKNINYVTVGRGDMIKGFSDISFYVFNPQEYLSYGDPNNDSVVIKAVTRKGNSILFCGDAESESMKDMLQFGAFMESDIMKVPHHGQGWGDILIAEEFVNSVNSAHYVVTNKSLQKLNKHSLDIINKQDADIYITGETGAVIVDESNGRFTLRRYCK